RLGEFPEILDRQRRRAIALLGLRDLEAFRAKPRERLPHGARTDFRGLGDVVDTQFAARKNSAGEDVASKRLEHAVRLGLVAHRLVRPLMASFASRRAEKTGSHRPP